MGLDGRARWSPGLVHVRVCDNCTTAEAMDLGCWGRRAIVGRGIGVAATSRSVSAAELTTEWDVCHRGRAVAVTLCLIGCMSPCECVSMTTRQWVFITGDHLAYVQSLVVSPRPLFSADQTSRWPPLNWETSAVGSSDPGAAGAKTRH